MSDIPLTPDTTHLIYINNNNVKKKKSLLNQILKAIFFLMYCIQVPEQDHLQTWVGIAIGDSTPSILYPVSYIYTLCTLYPAVQGVY